MLIVKWWIINEAYIIITNNICNDDITQKMFFIRVT